MSEHEFICPCCKETKTDPVVYNIVWHGGDDDRAAPNTLDLERAYRCEWEIRDDIVRALSGTYGKGSWSWLNYYAETAILEGDKTSVLVISEGIISNKS